MSFRYDAIQLFDMGFGPRLLSVTPPGCVIKPGVKLLPKDRGKAPGILTQEGWVEQSVYRHGCPDYATAKTWRDLWDANIGFAGGDGYVILDNDQGREFSAVLMALLNRPLRRYVMDPKHERDAFFLRVVDFVGDGVDELRVRKEWSFRNGTRVAKFSILGKGKQAVIAGVHPGTGAPYAWSRELTSLDDIPVLSEEKFEDTIRNLVVELDALGWSLDRPTPVSAATAIIGETSFSAPKSAPVSAVSAARPNGAGNNIPPIIPTPPPPGHNHPPSDKFAEAKSLLDEIPNRDSPPNITRSPIDEWLDDYANWVSVAYALIAFLGPLAHTPEAFDLWVVWSDGRCQASQTSESVWRSALAQPLRFGGMGLVKLVRSLVKPTPDFPDIEPGDPMIEPDPRPLWSEFKARWAYCPIKGFVDTHTGSVINRQAFSDKHAYLAPALKKELGFPGRGRKPVADMFLAQPDRPEVRDITYAPGDPVFIPDQDPRIPVFNNWRAVRAFTRVVTVPEVAPWLDHLLFVLGTDAERARFLRWCAFVARFPQFKPNWHYLVMSTQGLGKDTMTAPLKLAVGAANWCEELIYSLLSSFDYVIEHKLLIVGETAQPKQERARGHDLSTRLKPLLARPPDTLSINKKYLSPYYIPNRLAVILFSNEENPLQLERAQRRVHVVNRRAEKTKPLAYYVGLNDWLDKGGAELAAAYILNYPLSDAEKHEFIGGVAPETDDKTELENQNLHPHLAALEELIADARAGIRDGAPWTLVATADELTQMIKGKGVLHPSPQNTRTWLLDMERQKTGVRRLRVDPKEPSACGVTTTRIQGVQHGGRLWLLADTTHDGRLWSTLTTAEIIAEWKNLPPPKNATVIKHPKSAFPDDGEEPV